MHFLTPVAAQESAWSVAVQGGMQGREAGQAGAWLLPLAVTGPRLLRAALL